MDSLLNQNRPPAFCPGCTHEKIVQMLDRTFQNMNLDGNQIAIISDIGCSGLFDTFFHTHAFHGLHGRALTYATGIKMARPELTVIATMGDGGLGIGGAHLLAACRRNLDITLLILNNFNFGMTGGQFSATTPPDAVVESGFLNKLENPIDICEVARSAGAEYVIRCSGYQTDLDKELEKAIRFPGFSVVDICGICTGRYVQKNRLTPKKIETLVSNHSAKKYNHTISSTPRKEYYSYYKELSKNQTPTENPITISPVFKPLQPIRQEIVILGSAGQRILSAGEILCLAGLTAGLNASQKNEYNITVLTGPSIAELILSPDQIDYTGIDTPSIILALASEGVERRKHLFKNTTQDTIIIHEKNVKIPSCNASAFSVDFKGKGIKPQDWALASLAVLAGMNKVICLTMLQKAIELRFKEPIRSKSIHLIQNMVF
ncbi:MAG: 2-oxoglutarate synthase [Desulfobacterium sp.]|nr:2-oxoglutarate synthase [Desulfobacterium sp.]